jgi:hypothetical protein
MCIVALNWVWRQQLEPTAKLVLLSLADAADDRGVCWPSVATMARKCCVSTRTVRRSLQLLVAGGFLVVEPRCRADGSSCSNRYRLQLPGGDTLSSPPDSNVTPSGHTRQGPPDTGVSPRTTKGTLKESPPLPDTATCPLEPDSMAGGGRDRSRLVYPPVYPPIWRSSCLTNWPVAWRPTPYDRRLWPTYVG